MNNIFYIIRRILYITLGIVDGIFAHKSRIVILCYHSVSSDRNWKFNVGEKVLEQQLKLISKTHKSVPVSEIVSYIYGKKKFNTPVFAVTFDDGYKNIQSVIPLMKKLAVIPCVYLLSDTDVVNRKELGNTLPLLTDEDIQNLQSEKWEIGSHGATHIILDKKSKTILTREVTQSKKTLEKRLHERIVSFSYPKGKYSARVQSVVKEADYVSAVSMDDGQISVRTNPYTIPRIGVDGSHSIREFSFLCSPSVTTFRRLIKKSLFGRYF